MNIQEIIDKAKTLTWKHWIGGLFIVGFIFKVLTAVFGSPVPSCGSGNVVKKLNSIMENNIRSNGFTTNEVKTHFTKTKEIESTDTYRICKATLVIEKNEYKSEVIREYNIRKEYGNEYRITLK